MYSCRYAENLSQNKAKIERTDNIIWHPKIKWTAYDENGRPFIILTKNLLAFCHKTSLKIKQGTPIHRVVVEGPIYLQIDI